MEKVLQGTNKNARIEFMKGFPLGNAPKIRPEGLFTEDPYTKDTHHENGRVKQPSRSSTLGEERSQMKETHVPGNDR